MRRLFLLVVFGIVAAYYFPDSRRMMLEEASPLLNPVRKWMAAQEMDQITKDLVAYQRDTNEFPNRRNWTDWLEYRYALPESFEDAWGNTYQLQIWADSFAVLSYGPDRERGTGDDFRVVKPRPRRRR